MNASTSKTFSHHNSFALSNKFREKETETTAVFESSMTVRITRNTSCGSRELLLRNDRNSACHLYEFCVTNYFSFLCFLFFFLLTHIRLHNARTLKCPISFNIGTSKVVILFLFLLNVTANNFLFL